MKVSWIKYEKDKKSFKIPEALGFDIYKLSQPEKIDEKLNQLMRQEYRMIVVSDEIASFSQDIIKKYNKDKNINIIIASNKE